MAEFYAPGRDPEHDPGDREPDYRQPLSFDPVTRLYGADVSTRFPDGSTWVPGTWTVRGAVLDDAGVPEGWSWSSVPLDP